MPDEFRLDETLVMRQDVDMQEMLWRRTNALVACVSVATLLLIAGLMFVGPSVPAMRSPAGTASFNAAMNALTVAALTVGYVSIRRQQRNAHRGAMLGALVSSLAFLCGYILHHARVGSVPYSGNGPLRQLYFAILLPHILLAALEVPLVLFTVIYAARGQFERHRRIARFTLPVWLFVSASGVAVYFMLYWG
jgi:uncharacterized membrane protein YozB (DUF420 family)